MIIQWEHSTNQIVVRKQRIIPVKSKNKFIANLFPEFEFGGPYKVNIWKVLTSIVST